MDTLFKNPTKGSLSISHILRRMFFLEASHETVRKALHKEDLIPKTKPKPKKNPSKPRCFERSTPNQMWQSDIMCFRLGGKNAYLIGYIDDYSRFITGLGLYYSQTAQNVLETYRRTVSENSLPKEMLTDNSRQYTNWRGKTKFEKKMQKDGIQSQPRQGTSSESEITEVTSEERSFGDEGRVSREPEIRCEAGEDFTAAQGAQE